MLTTIDEGRLRFIFHNHWQVVKYDGTAFYREKIIPTGANLKAVDFIAIPHPDLNTLIMIEVKDFRGYGVESRERITSGDLVVEIIEKALHTLSAIYLVKYCKDSELSNLVTTLLTSPKKIELVLFMEQDAVIIHGKGDTRNKLRMLHKKNHINNIDFSLKQKLKNTIGIRSKVLNTELIKARDGYSVTYI